MALELSLLGTFEVTWDGGALPVNLNAARALLAYLVIEDGPQARERVAAFLWPDQSQESAFVNLRQTLVRLRRALPDTPLLDITPHTLHFQPNSSLVVVVDVERFEGLLARYAQHAHDQLTTCPECRAWLEEATALYRGEFLTDVVIRHSHAFEEWTLIKREQLHRLALDAWHTLTHIYESSSEFNLMRDGAARQLAWEPWREEAHRQLMRALVGLGQREAAIKQYQVCERVLSQELGIEPSVETRALFERIRVGSPAPAALTAPAPPHNLPASLTPFIGRETEISDIIALLRTTNTRLLTLVGAGGMGKTRLALEVGREVLHEYPDGVFFVSLTSLMSASAIAPAIASVLGVALHNTTPQVALLQALRDKRVLLILDNFEHVLDGVGLVVEILRAAPQVYVLATSRERLDVRGETVYPVGGMDYVVGKSNAAAATAPAVRLFSQSARRVQPDFRLNEATLPPILRICQLTQGMPLGLELAAAWTEALPLTEIVTEVERSADFLAHDWRDAPARQRSMRAVFDWSWRLLTEGEQQALRGLAVFRGGFTREAAHSVVGASLRVLASLVHKSLLGMGEGSNGVRRYAIHELLREFAEEQLDSIPHERADVEARHTRYYLQLVADHERRMARHEPREAAEELRREIDNVRRAWANAAALALAEDLDRAAFGLLEFFHLLGWLAEGEQTFRLALHPLKTALAGAEGTALARGQQVLSKLLATHASTLISLSRHAAALGEAEQAISLGQASGGVEGEALGYLVKGQAVRRLGGSSDAQALLERAVSVAHTARQVYPASELLPDIERWALNWLCNIALTEADYNAAQAYVERGLALCRSLGKLRGEMICMTDLVDIAKEIGDYEAAREYGDSALRLARQLAYRRGECFALENLADSVRLLGDYSQALALAQQTMRLGHEMGEPLRTVGSARLLSQIYFWLGDYSVCQHYLDLCDATLQAAGMPAREVYIGLLRRAHLLLALDQAPVALPLAEQAWHMVRELDGRSSQGDALVILGRVRARCGLHADAAAAFEEALAAYQALGHRHKAAEAHAALAWLALAAGDIPHALTQVEAVLPRLIEGLPVGIDEPFDVYLACYRVLSAAQDQRARAVLLAGRAMLRVYAARVPPPHYQSFLENVPSHHALNSATL